MAIDIDNIIEYYKNLLILQYNKKDKARAEIGLHINTLLANDIISQVQDGYNINTAVGSQLDVLGKYIGVDRFYSQIGELPGDFFALTSYSSYLTDDEVGMTDYANYATDVGDFVVYNDIASTVKLNDDDYRFILKMRIVQNNSDHSNKSIDDGLFAFFEDGVVLSDLENMSIVYFANSDSLSQAVIAFAKGVLPRPMGVNLNGLIEKDKKLFGFTNYSQTTYGTISTGFTNYTEGFDKSGETLTYEKVINF